MAGKKFWAGKCFGAKMFWREKSFWRENVLAGIDFVGKKTFLAGKCFGRYRFCREKTFLAGIDFGGKMFSRVFSRSVFKSPVSYQLRKLLS